MIDRIEHTAADVYESMMELESEIFNNKKLILENRFEANEVISNATIHFSANILLLFLKRLKHQFYIKGEFDKGNNLEKILELNQEAIGHKISSNALKVAMNITLYQINLDDTFMELLKDYSEYLNPLLLEVM